MRDKRLPLARAGCVKIFSILGAALAASGAEELSRHLQQKLRQAPGIAWPEIREELLAATEPLTWEAGDRPANLEYAAPEIREKLREFLSAPDRPVGQHFSRSHRS